MRGGWFDEPGVGMMGRKDARSACRRIHVVPARSSGVLLHPTSLPGGRLGDEARRFVDWLAAAGQSWWQVLPLGPPDEHGSPYKAASAFACSPALLADPDAPVSGAEVDRFVRTRTRWVRDWAAFAGDGAVEDQVRFQREWEALRDYAGARGVRLIGDIPIYVAPGSADHLAHPGLFEEGAVAGAPPDAWSETGQLWRNPLYDWTAMRETGYRWWIDRFERTFELVDVARIDHFRGFVAFWAVPGDADTALHGRWRRGPGRALFDAAADELGPLPLIAEDLGVITPAVNRLRDRLGLPGTVVLQFAFLEPRDADPLDLPENRAVYTATHDNETAAGWWADAPDEVRERVLRAAAARGIPAEEPHWLLVECALATPARLAVIPAQDVLGLGNEARMNTPGTEGGNWAFRLEPGALDDELAARLRRATRAAGR
jgi:4-alpha-glucanotransferase